MKAAAAFAALISVALVQSASAEGAPGDWHAWGNDAFSQAKTEHRLVLLDLEAVWCHWCHVMDQNTYSDPKVKAVLDSKFVRVRVDQDSSPALSARYGDWGWPATIIFGADGKELVKLRGYVEPDRMLGILNAVVADPTPGPSVTEDADVTPAASSKLTPAVRDKLIKAFDESWDDDHGGWGEGYKFIDADSMDLALEQAEAGDTTAAAHARRTFDAATALIDPVWGGVYQYSVGGDWTSPHYEKIMSFQAQYLRQYAQAWSRWHDPRYLDAARKIEGYLTTSLLGPDGAFDVSQDADLSKDVDGHRYYALDDKGRRALGIPRIDTHQYARENGWAIGALLAYYDATDDAKALEIAQKAAAWVIANRSLPDGGFRHGADDKGGPFLGDTLAMGNAFLDLYAATGERQWLARAEAAGGFIASNFKSDSGGFIGAKGESDVFKAPAKQIDDQVGVARFMNRLFRYSGQTRDQGLADFAMRYVAGAVADADHSMPGVLLADRELSSDPTHITIVGHKDDPAAKKLDQAARAIPAVYKRLDWWDTREGPLSNPDVTYPELDQAAAFACGNRLCSLPVFTPDDLQAAVAHMMRHVVRHDAEK